MQQTHQKVKWSLSSSVSRLWEPLWSPLSRWRRLAAGSAISGPPGRYFGASYPQKPSTFGSCNLFKAWRDPQFAAASPGLAAWGGGCRIVRSLVPMGESATGTWRSPRRLRRGQLSVAGKAPLNRLLAEPGVRPPGLLRAEVLLRFQAQCGARPPEPRGAAPARLPTSACGAPLQSRGLRREFLQLLERGQRGQAQDAGGTRPRPARPQTPLPPPLPGQ